MNLIFKIDTKKNLKLIFFMFITLKTSKNANYYYW